MRQIIFTFLILLVVILTQGQTKIDLDKFYKIDSDRYKNEYFLDSIRIDINKIWLDPDNIKEIYVVKKGDSNIYGQNSGLIYIISKDKKRIWTSLSEIDRQFTDTLKFKTKPSKLFLIDNKVIEDTSNVRLEITNITKIDILKDSETGVLHDPPQIEFLITTKLIKEKK